MQYHDMSGEPDPAAAVGSDAIARIKIPQPIQEPDRSHDFVDGRHKENEQAISGHPQGYRVGKLHAAEYAVAERFQLRKESGV